MRSHSFLVFIIFLLSACSAPTGVPPTPMLTTIPTNTLSATSRPTSMPSPSLTPSPTLTPSVTPSPSPTPVPTYIKLRGQVNVAQVVCHYGPGKPYLYKYGLIGGSNLEIIARVEPGEYLEVQAIGGNNPCWVNPKWMDVTGDLKDLQPIHPLDVKLPQSPYYGPLSGVSAERDGNNVTITWHPLILRAGDDSEQVPYVIEAFVCRAGQIAFDPVGAYIPRAVIQDEPGCRQSSYARITAAEKHGYTRFVEIPWPPAEASPSVALKPTP